MRARCPRPSGAKARGLLWAWAAWLKPCSSQSRFVRGIAGNRSQNPHPNLAKSARLGWGTRPRTNASGATQSLHRGGFAGEDFADAADLGADSLQLFLDVLVTAVDVVDAVNDGFAVGDQSGEHERRRGAQIAGQHGSGAERSLAANHGAASFNLDVGAHAHQFQGVHEAVFENVLRNDRRALGLRGQRHELCLTVGGEAGIFFGAHVGSGERIVSHDADRVGRGFRLDSDFVKLAEKRSKMRGIAGGDVEIASGHGGGEDESARLNAVGNDAVLGALQMADSFDANGGRAGAFDAGSHLVEQGGEVGDFRLAGAVLENGFTFRESGGHQQVFGASDGDSVEHDLGALEALGAGFDVAVFLRDPDPELLESFDVQINGTSADGASSGKRDAGAAAAGDQRSEHERGGAHGLDQFVRSFRGSKVGAVDGGAVLGASVAEFDFGAHGGQQIARGLNVADLRNVFEDDGLIGEQGCGHAGKGSVFGAADADGAEQRLSAADDELVHG